VLSRYTDVKKIIEHIKTKKLEEDIVQENINNLASNFVNLNFSKKLGRKKLGTIKKKTIDIFKSQTVKNYSKFLISSKQINYIQKPYNIKYTMPQKFFNKIKKIPPPTHFNINNIHYITRIQDLDNFISETIIYNNKQQIIDE